jgi:hypothetical protein
MPWLLFPQKRTLVPIELEAWWGLRAGTGHFREEKTLLLLPEVEPQTVQPIYLVTIPTMLPHLQNYLIRRRHYK